ncbi:uncharacterized protein LOC133343591 isoform X2 [Lethenteron reissneri]|uniref:uncharacterized protein LOC133343591 isoform X2 n=1 Tax=Lethenteron reissneri TaxID=7753 RepID=UPI002AB6A41E|nr:uncharacterized protein LOC133343591 isoform X2 [Lethenteron reissneri]
MASRGCKHPADTFCYVCGQLIKTRAKKYSVEASAKMCEAYKAYFGMPVGDQDKPWALHFTCEQCKNNSGRFGDAAYVSGEPWNTENNTEWMESEKFIARPMSEGENNSASQTHSNQCGEITPQYPYSVGRGPHTTVVLTKSGCTDRTVGGATSWHVTNEALK